MKVIAVIFSEMSTRGEMRPPIAPDGNPRKCSVRKEVKRSIRLLIVGGGVLTKGMNPCRAEGLPK